MASKRWLYICCNSGLGDRLLALAGAQRIARHTGLELIVYWDVNDRCKIPFQGLFTNPIHLADGQDLHRLLHTHHAIQAYNAWVDRPIPKYHQVREDGDPDAEIVIIKCWNYPLFDGERPVPEFRAEVRSELAALQPVAEVQEAIDAFPMPSGAVGVHIRRGDDVSRFGVSGEGHFMTLMHAVLKRAPDTKFFLSTDSMETESLFDREFGGQLAIQRKSGGGRSAESGMREALVDMLLLSRTRSIIGNTHSAFSRVASLWGDRALVLAGDRTAGPDIEKAVGLLLSVRAR